jgi:hypothetical protein
LSPIAYTVVYEGMDICFNTVIVVLQNSLNFISNIFISLESKWDITFWLLFEKITV